MDRVIDYDYDNLYRLISTDYSTGELYEYDYDSVGNRLQQIINGDTISYLYDEANRLAQVDDQAYTFDANGNLLQTGAMTNTWNAANRLISANRESNIVEPIYNGVGDRMGQTFSGNTTYFALDIQGLPEVIQTSDGNSYLHLPGVIVAENASGETRYLLSDGLGSVRQAIDETGVVVNYNEFDPYGNPVNNDEDNPYGYTGEWWEDEVGLLHLRARWYLPQDGIFLSKDAWEGDELRSQSLNGWSYVGGNPINRIDPNGRCYGPVRFLRSIPGERMLCGNLDLAIIIYTHPQATLQQKEQAAAYMTLWWIGHSSLVAGVYFLGWGAFLELAMAGGELAEQIEEGSPPSPLPEEAQPCPVNDDPLPPDTIPLEPPVYPTPSLDDPLEGPLGPAPKNPIWRNPNDPDRNEGPPRDPEAPLGGDKVPPLEPPPPGSGGEEQWIDDPEDCRILRSNYELIQKEIRQIRRELIETDDEFERAILEGQLREFQSWEFLHWLEYTSKGCTELTGPIPPPG